MFEALVKQPDAMPVAPRFAGIAALTTQQEALNSLTCVIRTHGFNYVTCKSAPWDATNRCRSRGGLAIKLSADRLAESAGKMPRK
jgi:hypothetical protein